MFAVNSTVRFQKGTEFIASRLFESCPGGVVVAYSLRAFVALIQSSGRGSRVRAPAGTAVFSQFLTSEPVSDTPGCLQSLFGSIESPQSRCDGYDFIHFFFGGGRKGNAC